MASKPKLMAIVAWLAPSVVAAFAGASIAGLVEVRAEPARFPIAVAAIAPIGIPVLIVASVIARALYAAWLPETLLAELREERGGMPRLAAWVGVVWLGLLGLAWAMFQGTWLLVSWTAFKASSISFLAPALAVLSLLVIVALSRPAAELFTIIARWIDRRWQRVAPGSLLRAPVIFLGAAISACLAGYLIWTLLVTRRLPNLAPGVLAGVAAGALATAAVHAAWRGPRSVKLVGGGLVVGITIALGVLGVRALHAEPATAIAIWSESRLAGAGLERIADLESLRDELPVTSPVVRSGPHRDLVVITLDGVRTDRAFVAMPTTSELARRGTSFDWAFAPSTTERRSIPSLLTGISAHRVRGDASDVTFVLDPRHVAFAERLRAAGYQTAAFTPFTERTWLRGFEHRGEPPAAADWIRARTSTQPLLVWIHLAVPWPADRDAIPSDRRLAVYDAGLATVDRAIANTLAAFSTRTVETTPIVAIAGIRGVDLGEHGAFGSLETNLYNTQLRVPLIIAGPTIRATRISEAVSIIDLAPTLVDLAGYVPPRGMASDGISLTPITSGLRVSMSNFAFAAILPDAGPTVRAQAVIRGTTKLIDSGGTLELYDLKIDPDERLNLVNSKQPLVNELRALMTSRLRAGSISPF